MTHTENHNQGAVIYATAKIPIPEPQPLGADPVIPLHRSLDLHRWCLARTNHRMTGPSRFDRIVTAIAAALLAALIAIWLSGCIPVTIRPQFDQENKPIAIPVTPIGSISADGTLVPIYPVSDKSPQPTNWAGIAAGITTILTAVLAAYGINLRGALSKMTTVARINSELADANAAAETDEQVQRNKEIAFQKQLQANVHKQTQIARGK